MRTSSLFAAATTAVFLVAATLVAAPQNTAPPTAPPTARPATPPATRPAAPAAPATPAAPAARAPVAGEKLVFDFKDPKGVNAVGILLDSTLEPIFGTGAALSGTIELDPADPTTARGTLSLETKSVRMSNERMTAVLHGADWLDAEKHPSIDVKLVSVAKVQGEAASFFGYEAKVEVTIKGKTVPMTIPVRATYLPGRLGDRMRGATGDLLVLRSIFIVKRSDFGIKTDTPVDTVADEIQISAAVVGSRKSG